MKKLFLLLMPLLLLVGCSSSGGSAPAATATTAAVTTDVVVGMMQVCTYEGKNLRGLDCQPQCLERSSFPTDAGAVKCMDQIMHGRDGFFMSTRWELTIRTPQGTTYKVEVSFKDDPEPVLGQSWP